MTTTAVGARRAATQGGSSARRATALQHDRELALLERVRLFLAEFRPRRDSARVRVGSAIPRGENVIHLGAETHTLPNMCAVGHLQSFGQLVDGLTRAAEETARATKRLVYVRRRKRGLMLRAGLDTPLWDELARAVARRLVRHGDKAQLARILGVPRQRLHVLLVARTACPDAEQTLRLLQWLAAEDRARARGRPTASLPLPRANRSRR